MATSLFSGVEQGPAIEVFKLNQLCVADTFDKKVNLGVGGEYCNCLPNYVRTNLGDIHFGFLRNFYRFIALMTERKWWELATTSLVFFVISFPLPLSVRPL